MCFHLVWSHLIHAYARPLKIQGAGNLEQVSGPVIFASHHESHSDTPIILAALPRLFKDRLVIAAAADVLFANPASGALTALLFGAVRIERRALALTSVRQISELLSRGNSLLIYPRGNCSMDGSAGKFKLGVGLLVRVTKAPVVLVGIKGSRNFLPLGRRWPQPAAVTVWFSRPMIYEQPFG